MLIKGDTRSLDNGPYKKKVKCGPELRSLCNPQYMPGP